MFKMEFLFFIFVFTAGIHILTDRVDGLKMEDMVGGTEAPPDHSYTYQVSVQRNHRHRCGGAILSDRIAATTAQCVINITTGDYIVGLLTVVAGALNVSNHNEPKFETSVKKIYTHITFSPHHGGPGAAYRSVGDLSLLKVEKGFDSAKNFKFVKLVISDYWEYLHFVLTVTGYGYNRVLLIKEPSSSQYREIGFNEGRLRHALVQVVKDETCVQFHPHYMPANHLCAKMLQRRKGYTEGVCGGDIGAPLVHSQNMLAGLLTVAPPGCDEGKRPGVYIKLSYYRQFVLDVLADKKTNDMRIASLKKRWGLILSYEFVDE